MRVDVYKVLSFELCIDGGIYLLKYFTSTTSLKVTRFIL